jgi:hypothetical protein
LTLAIAEWRTAVRLDVGRDTLVVNGFDPVMIGAKLINRFGSSVWRASLRYAEQPGSIAHVSKDGNVTCKGIGDDVITISHGSLKRDLLVRCRPITMFGWNGVRLNVGGPPGPLEIEATGPDRRPVTLLSGQATVLDTQYARLRDNMLYPIAVGYTRVKVDFSGGTSTTIGVSVTKAVIDTSLTMVAGEWHTWHLPPGYYHITLNAADSTAGPSLIVAAMNANCAKGRNGPQEYYCITKPTSALVVRNVKPPRTPERMGRLVVVQVPHAWANDQKGMQ